jgi:hypothetical protein
MRPFDCCTPKTQFQFAFEIDKGLNQVLANSHASNRSPGHSAGHKATAVHVAKYGGRLWQRSGQGKTFLWRCLLACAIAMLGKKDSAINEAELQSQTSAASKIIWYGLASKKILALIFMPMVRRE